MSCAALWLCTTASTVPQALAQQGNSTGPESTDLLEPVPRKLLGDGECLLPDLCFGPVFSVGMLNPLGVGLHMRYGAYLGLAVDYQFLPAVTISDVSVSASLFVAEGRYYPTGGALFVSAGLALQHLVGEGSVTLDDSPESMRIEGTINVTALKLGIGFTGHDGLVVGIDLGLHVPVRQRDLRFGYDASLEGNADVQQVEEDIRDAGGRALEEVPILVQLNLIRIGYLF